MVEQQKVPFCFVGVVCLYMYIYIFGGLLLLACKDRSCNLHIEFMLHQIVFRSQQI